MNHSTSRMVITFRRKKLYLSCVHSLILSFFQQPAQFRAKHRSIHYTKVIQVCLLGPTGKAIINFEILMERRQKEQGKYSKMFTVENYTFIQDSKLQTTSITLHPAKFTVKDGHSLTSKRHVETLPQFLKTPALQCNGIE